MDFSYSELQKMLAASARDFLEVNCTPKYVREMTLDEKGYTPEMWRQMAEMGWMGLIIPDAHGGAGGKFLDLAILLQEMGRVCLPGPFFSTVVLGGLSLIQAAGEEQKRELLPRLAEGRLILTLALSEAGGRYGADAIQLRANQSGGEFVLSGTKLFVPDAHVSDYLVCAARTENSEPSVNGVTLFLVDVRSAGLTTNLLKTISGDKQCEVVFEDVNVPQSNVLGSLNGGWPILEKILDLATIARCSEMAGGARRLFEITVEYAKQRKAFGRAIGSFQAIQHYCANMLVKLDGVSLMVNNAAWRLSEGLPAAREASMTKALANESFGEIAALCLQIHGAVGFTDDHDLSLYFKRAKAGEISLGSTGYHLKRVSSLYSRLKSDN